MYHLSLLRSITNKKNLNSLHESKKKNSFPTKYVSIRESTSIAKRAPPSATLTAVQNSTSTPIIPVIKSFRASLRYFFFFFFYHDHPIPLRPVTGGGRGGFKLSKRNDLSSQQVTLARVNRRKGLATTPPGLERGDVNIARTIRNRW